MGRSWGQTETKTGSDCSLVHNADRLQIYWKWTSVLNQRSGIPYIKNQGVVLCSRAIMCQALPLTSTGSLQLLAPLEVKKSDWLVTKRVLTIITPVVLFFLKILPFPHIFYELFPRSDKGE